MSAYILSDLHLSVIAQSFAPSPETAQDFADKLKRINIESVNYRYRHGKSTRVTRCKPQALEANQYNAHDLAALVGCWAYQSSEMDDSLEFELVAAYLGFKVQAIGGDSEASNLRSI